MSTATTAAPAARHATTRKAGDFAGTGTLIRFILRRDRVRIPVWVAALVLGTVATLNSFTELYATAADRAATAQSMSTPAGLAMTGPRGYLADYNVGSMLGHQMLGFMGVLVGLMSVLLLTRHTRAEEEAGRAELVRSGVLGRHAHLAAALTVTAGVNLVLAALLALGLGGLGVAGVTWGGSLLYGAAHAAMGLVFAGVAAVTVQVSEHSRAASGLAFAVLGLAYVLRAAGDIGDGVASWMSPIGWAQRTYVYVDNRWWPLLLAVAAAGILAAVGFQLSTRRDAGAGLRQPRAGAAEASNLLVRPFGFAVRLHRGLLAGFAFALFVLGVMYGSILDQIESMISSIAGAEEMLAQLGGASLAESFVSMVMLVTAVVSSVYVVIALTKLRAEETAGRAEPVLATDLSRTGWMGSHIAVALVGGALVVLAGGLGMGVAGAVTVGDASLVPKLVAAALAYVPALWVTAGVAIALFGWLPRFTALAWVVVVYAFGVGYLGQLLQFPGWLMNLSPFGHVPQLPAADFAPTPIIVLTVLAALLVAFGLEGFRRRDVEAV